MQHSSRVSNGQANGHRAPKGDGSGGPYTTHMLAASHAPAVEPERVPSPSVSAGTTSRPGQTEPFTKPLSSAVPVPLSPDEAGEAARRRQESRLGRGNGKGHTALAPQPAQEIKATSIPLLPPLPKAPTRLTPMVQVVVQTLVDVAATAGAFGLAFLWKFPTNSPQADPAVYLTMLSVTVATIVLTFYFSKLYILKRGASRVDEFYKIAAAVSMGTVLSLATNSLILGEVFNYSRQVLLTGWLLTILFVTALRVLYSVVLGELRKHGVDVSRVLIVGTGPTAQMVDARLRHHSTLGYKVVGMVDSSGIERGLENNRSRPQVVGKLANLPKLVRESKVDEVIVALTGASDKQLKEVMDLLQDETVSIKIYPDAFQLMTQNEVSVGELSGLPLMSVKDVALRGWNRRFKRAFDILFSIVILVLTSPLMLVIAIAIKLGSPGPVFFIQERVGLDGKPFQLVKFRTMKVVTDSDDAQSLREGMPGWTVRNDPRRTRLGTFLRRFSLDELPQFFNVLIGEMSVVGPRPEQPAYVQEFAQRIDRYLRRHREKAGLTGWAQINGLRGDSSIEMRTAADLYYVENWSVLFDLKIIVRTVLAMVRGKNAY